MQSTSRGGVVVGEHVQQGVVFAFHERVVDADVAAGDAEGIGDLVLGHVYHLGKFLCRGLAFVLLLEFAESFVDFVQGAHLVEREAHYAALLCERLQYALAYPPNCIGDEFEASGLVEFFGGLDEAQIAFIDDVGKAEALVLVLFCH